MRISDWSSDVCSSDLSGKDGLSLPGKTRIVRRMSVTVSLPSATASLPTLRSWVARWRRSAHDWTPHRVANRQLSPNSPDILDKSDISRYMLTDRKSVVSGKSVSVRVDLGGRRILKKKKK